MWKGFDQALNAALCARANSPCLLSSHTVPIADIDEAALRLTSTPGAADKVAVTFAWG